MRGRPTAAASHVDKAFSDSIKASMKDKTTRTQAAHFYCAAACGLLSESEAASEIPYLDGIFKTIKTNGMAGIEQKTEIVEQLGRMLEQDGYSTDDVKKVATAAARAYHEGCTVKQIKAYIRHGRTTGEW